MRKCVNVNDVKDACPLWVVPYILLAQLTQSKQHFSVFLGKRS